MAKRGHFLLMTPLDLHASCDELVRNYELVRRNIKDIAPFLPENAEIDIFAGGTPHNATDIPLLGLYLPDEINADGDIGFELQNAIDEWFVSQDPDRLERTLMDIQFPTWEYLVSVPSYPDRNASQNGG